VLEYVKLRPDQLWSQPPKHEEPFSTPRSWHMLSDALTEYPETLSDAQLGGLAFGCLSPPHAGQFRAYLKQLRGKYKLSAILDGDARWPDRVEDRDLLYFLSQSFRARLIKELPGAREQLSGTQKELAHRAKGLMKELAALSLEMAQLVVDKRGEGGELPGWFLVDLVRDLPRLASAKE
jgi:hypothetical protein